jgi:hypothetical protein
MPWFLVSWCRFLHNLLALAFISDGLQVKPGAEFDGVKSALMDHLPAELPTKDELAPLQPLTAPVEEVAAPMSEEQLVDSLIGLPWEFIINKDARQEWARMDRPFRSATSVHITCCHHTTHVLICGSCLHEACCLLQDMSA